MAVTNCRRRVEAGKAPVMARQEVLEGPPVGEVFRSGVSPDVCSPGWVMRPGDLMTRRIMYSSNPWNFMSTSVYIGINSLANSQGRGIWRPQTGFCGMADGVHFTPEDPISSA